MRDRTDTFETKDFEWVVNLVLDFCGCDFVGNIAKEGPPHKKNYRPGPYDEGHREILGGREQTFYVGWV